MDLLTVFLPLAGAAVVYFVNAYKKKTGTDPLANKPVLQLLFQLLSKQMPAGQQLQLAQKLGLHTDPEFMSTLGVSIESAAWDTAHKMYAPQHQDSPAMPASPLPPPAIDFTERLVHVPIRLTITPEFLHPDGSPDPSEGAATVKLAAA